MFQQTNKINTEEETKHQHSSTQSTQTTPQQTGDQISYGESPIVEPAAAPVESSTATPDTSEPTSAPAESTAAPTETTPASTSSTTQPSSTTNQPDNQKDTNQKQDQDTDKKKDDKDQDNNEQKNQEKENQPSGDNNQKNENTPSSDNPPTDLDSPPSAPSGPAAGTTGSELAKDGAAAAEKAAEAGVKAGAQVGEKLAEEAATEAAADTAAAGAAATGVGAPVAGAIEVAKYGKYALDLLDFLWQNKHIIAIIIAIPLLMIFVLSLGIFGWFMGYGPEGSQNKEPAMVSAQVEPFAKATGLPAQVSRLGLENQDTNQATTKLIASATNISGNLKNLASTLSGLEDELEQLANQTIIKADTSEEMIPLLEKMKNLNETIDGYQPNDSPDDTTDDIQYYNYLQGHYSALESKWLSLADFNETFEYLLLQTGQGAEINGQKIDDQTLRASRQTNLGKMLDLAATRQKTLINQSTLSDEEKQTQIQLIEDHVATINSTLSDETKPRDDQKPPALEFADSKELAILLPQTKADYVNYGQNNIIPDSKIYYLLSYVFHVWEQTGEDYENYKKDNVIQAATTPNDILAMCGDNLENDPKTCALLPTCGISQTLYSSRWLADSVDNIGVPYKNRSHLKIWLGLNAPYYTDEKNQAEKANPDSLNMVNTHYDLRAMDISEIGLYNERLDCAGCRGLQTCPGTCPEVPMACCPILLDSAQDVYQPVKVQWAHNSFANNILANATDILPTGDLNQFGLTGTIGDLISNPLENIFGNIGLDNLDFYQLMNGDFTSFMANIGQNYLGSLFGQLGLPVDIDPLNPNFDSLVSNIGSDYLNQAFNFAGGSFSPVLSSLISGDYQDVALDMFNRSVGEINLSPTISGLLSDSLSSGNQTQSTTYSLANTGLQQLNTQTFSWPNDVIDTSSLAGTGFTSIGNRLGQNTLNQILSLPSSGLYDPDNPQTTFASSSAAILAEQANNQSIANEVNQQLLANQTPTLYQILKNLSTDDLQSLLQLPSDKITKIYDYLQNPDSYQGGHSAFINDIAYDLDYAQLTTGNLNLNEYALKTIIEKGTNPTTGDQYALSSIMAEILLDRLGATYSEEDAAKLPYALDYVAANNRQDTTTEQQIANKFQQTFSQSSESIDSYRQRLANIINNAGQASTYANYYQNTTIPLKLNFAPSDTFYLLNGSSGNFDYQDTTYLLDFSTNQDFSLSNLLHEQNIDLRSLTYVTQTDYENQNNNPVDLANLQTNTTYYAYPQIILSEILIPGLNPYLAYHNNLGAFKLLETTTYILQKSKDKAAQITITRTTNTSSANAYETAFKNKYLLSIKNTDNSLQTVDYLAHLGGTNYVYQTLNGLGQNQTTSIQNLANIGTLTTAYNLTGIDISDPANLNLNESQIKDLINTMGIVSSWTTDNFTSSQNQMLNFVQQNNVFGNLAFQNSDIDFNNIFNSISSGNVYQTLNNVPLFQENYQSISDQFGDLPIDQFYNNFIANPSPENILSSTEEIMANYISQNSTLDKVSALQEITNTLQGDPANFSQLLTNSTLQNSVFKNVNPALLSDISSIYSNILSGNINLDTGLSMISTGSLIDRLAGSEAYSQFIGQYGGSIVNALQNLDPESIANTAFNQFSDQINGFLTNNNLSGLFPNGLNQLFSGDINQFVTDTALNYLQENLLTNLPVNLQGPLFNNLQSLLNGNLSLSSLTQLITPQLSDLLSNVDFNLTDPFSDLSSGLDLSGGIAQGAISGLIGGLTSQIFEPCKSKIANDNMIHLTDIILSFDRNRRTQYFYGITTQTNGQLTTEDQTNAHLILPKFYWHQMFSDYPKKVFDKITEKATEKLETIWPRDDSGLSDTNVRNDVWKNDCTNRENQFLTKCQDYIHVNF